MMPTLAPPSVLSAPQRRCQILLTLFQPGLTATTATFSELNGVDDDIASLDISETGREISKTNRPAPYSKDNVPYKPKRWARVSLQGYKDGDYADRKSVV